MTNDPEYVDVEITNQSIVQNRTTGFDILPMVLKKKPKLTPEILEAIMEIQTGLVSNRYIQERTVGGRKLGYISHIHATETMNTVFGWDWDYQVVKYEIMDDGSALVHAQLDVWRELFDGGRVLRRFVEVGSHVAHRAKDENKTPLWDVSPDGTGAWRLWTMNSADRILSATSRGLLRCMLRAFNYGAHLYEDSNPPISALNSWGTLLRLGALLGISKDEQVESLKEIEITQENLIERYSEAIELYYKPN